MTRTQWFSSAELAALRLPGLSSSKRKINERAQAEHWAVQTGADGTPLCRQRAGRGGGTEWHVALLPSAARLELVRRGLAEIDAPAAPTNIVALPVAPASSRWAWYERQSDKAKAEARARLAAIDAIEQFWREGLTRSAAVATVSAQTGRSMATLWNWLSLVAGVPAHDRLAYLAPGYRGGGREAEIDPRLWQAFLSDWLRPEQPTFAAAYETMQGVAAALGITGYPCRKTFERKVEREVDARVVTLKRGGAEALRRSLPAQQRSVADLHAMELVNIDGHRWDVFVRWPDGTIARPMMIAIQDVYSRRMLAWRIAADESAADARLCFADLFRRYGIPKGLLADNGRAFASKWLTGGIPNRFRFKVRDDEPLGLLTQLGVTVHWATPYRGQSKPIERGFRDFATSIAKHVAFAGAYTGNRPDAKPENYASAAVPLELFERVVARGIAAHNARPGRRTEMAAGESFDAVFERSYAAAPIGRATPEQLRLALLAADRVRADRRTGEIVFHGNRYWCAGLGEVAGERLTIRFDPDALHTEVHAYAADGRFVATVPVIEAVGFLDVAAAKARAKQEADYRRAVRHQAELLDLLSASDLAAMLPDTDAEPAPLPEPRVVRPVRVRGSAAVAAVRPAGDVMDRFAAGLEAFEKRNSGRLRLVE